MLIERLLENLALRVDTFATCRVAPGWRLRLPALDWVTFHYVLEGQGELLGTSDGSPTLSRGSLAVVPPHQVHGLQCGGGPWGERGVSGEGPAGGVPEHRAGPEDERALLVACGRVQVLYGPGIGLFDRLPDSLVLDFGHNEKVRTIFEGLLDEVRSSRPGFQTMASNLMSESLIHVFRRLCFQADCALPWLQALEDPHLEKAIEAMLESPEQPHTVALLASQCFLSRSSFARRFREAFGQPPMEYLRGIRLRRAAQLLRREPPPPISTVAARVGFRSRSQFSRAFKEYFHCPPSEFKG